MKLRRKFVKAAIGSALVATLFAPMSCNVSPELVQSVFSALMSQAQQGGFNFSGQGNFNLGPGNGPHANDDSSQLQSQ